MTFIHKAERTQRCTVLADTPVIRIEAGPNDRITSVAYMHDGAAHSVDTRVLVVACGAIETPRLLLLSQNAHAPSGIGNETDHVGKHFMETIFWVTSGLHPDELGSYRGVPSDVISWTHNAPDAVPGVVGGCRFTSCTAGADFLGPIAYATRAIPTWGKRHKDAMRASFGRILSIGSIGESLPNDLSYVDLDPAAKDEFGQAIARIHSHLPENELRRLEFMAAKCRDILKAAGVEERIEEYGAFDVFSSTHVFGTCRMGTRAEESVADPDGRLHRWKNLFITDASVFPSTGGGESPALTIHALALRSAEKIMAAFARREA